MSTYSVSLAQMNIALGDVEANLATFQSMCQLAHERGSEVVVFPELWSTGYVLDRAEAFASLAGRGVFEVIAQTAQELDLTIIGSILEKTANGVANSLTVATPDGKMVGTYHKLHLFRLFEEEKYLEEGAQPLALDMGWGKTGFGICYDLRFPELFRLYSRQEGTSFFILPAEWPQLRVGHWRTLLQARAIENQSFMMACNAVGQTGNTVFGGHSLVVDPWGNIVAEGGDTPELITATIDTTLIADVRKRIPVFEDIRRDIYG